MLLYSISYFHYITWNISTLKYALKNFPIGRNASEKILCASVFELLVPYHFQYDRCCIKYEYPT